MCRTRALAMSKSPTPTLDKLSAVAEKRNAICGFLEWLQEKHIELASYHAHSDACLDEDEYHICGMSENVLYSVNKSHEKLALEFFDIDPADVEKERRAIIDSLNR
jgi:hypothetical protein